MHFERFLVIFLLGDRWIVDITINTVFLFNHIKKKEKDSSLPWVCKKIYHSIHQNVVKSINDTLNCASCTICFFFLTHFDTISVQSTCTCITQQTQDNMKSDLPHT